jgi:hypothetical protein
VSIRKLRTEARLSQFNGGGYIILFSQFETDAFPLRGPAELAAAFQHKVRVIISLTEVSEDYAAQLFMVHDFEQIAGVLV